MGYDLAREVYSAKKVAPFLKVIKGAIFLYQRPTALRASCIIAHDKKSSPAMAGR